MTTTTSAASHRHDEPGGVRPRRRGPSRLGAEVFYTLVVLPVAIVGFVYSVVGITLGIGLIVTVLGLPMLAVVNHGARGLGALSRGLQTELLDGLLPRPLSRPARVRRRPGAFGWVRAALADGPAWRAHLFHLAQFPVAIWTFVLSVVVWSCALGGATYAIWRSFLPVVHDSEGVGHRGAQFGSDFYMDTWPRVAAVTICGVVLLLLAPAIIRLTLRINAGLGRALLGPRSCESRSCESRS